MKPRTTALLTALTLVVAACSGCSGGDGAGDGRPDAPNEADGSGGSDGSPRSGSASGSSRTVTPVPPPDIPDDVLPPARRTVWNPGVTYGGGGIPERTEVCATLSPGDGDDTAAIQEAIDTCPDDQVVQLTAGTFEIDDRGIEIMRSDVTLRGEGVETRLVKPEGAEGAVVYVSGGGPDLREDDYPGPSIPLTEDAVQGERSVAVERTDGLAVGEYLYLDRDTMDDPDVHWTEVQLADEAERRYFNRTDRSLAQVVRIAAIDGNVLTFETPFHTTFGVDDRAEVTRFLDNDGNATFVEWVGIEDLYVEGGTGGDWHGNVALDRCGYCWVSGIESNRNRGTAVGLYSTYRSEIRDSYVHSTAWPHPGGDGYLLGLHFGAADNLVENNIVVLGNKVMTMRASGGGNVIAYNYMDDAYGGDYRDIAEVGLNAAHYTTPHMELFEGNLSFNFDGDIGFGNSLDITVFRNHFTGLRADVGDVGLSDVAMRRAIGIQRHHRRYNFLANVLGHEGQELTGQEKFVYELTDEHHLLPDSSRPFVAAMWALGYPGDGLEDPIDPEVAATAIRHGNFDFVTEDVVWAPDLSHELPPSLYAAEKPAFFGDAEWPWVAPERDGGSVGELPAHARFLTLLESQGAP
ncbi:MAG TPA: hypothetical protein VIL36_08130 [Acidimicrobiales bacterium]